ncbi:MAG: FkbM family methyltransferase [Bacteroidota bacterium]
MANSAPIVLFVYNRPKHTLRTLEALSRNILADQSTLYVFADGPKVNATNQDIKAIEATRQIVRQRDWCKEVIVEESSINQGLADSIVTGVSHVVNTHGSIIVLEDDIETSPGFLQYMNDALTLYQDEEKVMHISSYMFPVDKQLPSTFFYNTASCWGWGTWKRAWQHYNHDATYLAQQIKVRDQIQSFNIEESYPFYQSLLANAHGEKKTWAVRWYASFFLRKGLALHPYPSLTNNIGFDASGENCSTNDLYYWPILAQNIEIEDITLTEFTQARRAMKQFYRTNMANKKKTLFFKFTKKTKNLIPSSIKHHIKIRTSQKYQEYYQDFLEKRRLKNMPRRTPTSTIFLGKTIKIVDAKSYLFIQKEIFEQEIYKFNTNNPQPYILDCGANIGLSLIYFKLKYPRAHIVAFEPDERVYQALEENIRGFGLENIELVNKGLWSEETTLEFISEGSDAGHFATPKSNKENVIAVKTTKLRNYLNKKVDFLKIDIEGAETKVLLDSADLLSQVDKLFVEYHSYAGQKQNLDTLLKVLKDSGFRYQIDSPGFRVSQPYTNRQHKLGMDMQLNIYAHRQSNEDSTH